MARKSPSAAQRRPGPSNRVLATLAGSGIIVPDPADVASYLASHRGLAKLLPSVCEQARREFGPEAELVLKVYRDPEIDDRHLTLYVSLPAYPADSMTERMDRVTEPFHEELCRASGFLLVTTNFRPPGAAHGV